MDEGNNHTHRGVGSRAMAMSINNKQGMGLN